MRSIVVLGAGRSSSALINYLLEYGVNQKISVVVGDVFEAAAQSRIGNHPSGRPVRFDIRDTAQSSATVSQADVVVSLLPANYHPVVAQLCLEHRKHLVTASYVSDGMKALDKH